MSKDRAARDLAGATATIKAALKVLGAGHAQQAQQALEAACSQRVPAKRRGDAPHALAEFYYWRALLALSLGALPEADRDSELAASLAPAVSRVLTLRAEVLKAQGKPLVALLAYEGAVRLEPGRLDWRYNLANAYGAVGQTAKALETYVQVLALDPEHGDAMNNLALLLQAQGEGQRAEALWTQALGCDERFEAARLNRALYWTTLGRYALAQAELETVLSQNPAQVQALLGLGAVHTAAKAPQAAMQRYEQAFALAPHEPFLLGQLMMAKLQLAHWQGIDQLFAHLNEGLAAGLPLCTPFSALALTDAPHWQLQVAQAFEQRTVALQSPKAIAQVNPHTNPQATQALALRWAPGERVKLAYFSADMHEHATAYLIAELFEQHDRSQFEVFVFSYGKKSDDAAQRRIKAAVEHWVEVSEQSDAAIVQAARAAGIHIAVDLKGYTLGGRPSFLPTALPRFR